MSRANGRRKEVWLAEYLRRRGWFGAEAQRPGLPGTDILGIPGTVWESKSAKEFRPKEFVAQAKAHARRQALAPAQFTVTPGAEPTYAPIVPIVVYWPERCGEVNAGNTLAIVPLDVMCDLLKAAGY